MKATILKLKKMIVQVCIKVYLRNKAKKLEVRLKNISIVKEIKMELLWKQKNLKLRILFRQELHHEA